MATPVGGDAAGAVDARLDIDRLADLSALDQGADGEEVDVETAVLVNGEELSRLLRGSRHFVKIGDGEGNGLFADHVLARLERADDDLLMYVVRCGAEDDVHLRVGERLLKGRVGVDAVFLCGIDSLFGNIVDTGERHDVALLRPVRVPCALSAVTDDRKILFHENLPLFFSPKG